MTRDEKIAKWMGFPEHQPAPDYSADPAAFLELRKKLLADGWVITAESLVTSSGVVAWIEKGELGYQGEGFTEPEALAMAVERMLEDRTK